jgi:hypothetical protein
MTNEVIKEVEETAIRTALNMLKQNIDLKLITQVTGMSIDKIIKLKASTFPWK